jgi:hypothetical protein
MPPKRKAAVVFVHGLARKPAPDKLKELWLEALGRNNPRPDTFAGPNDGLNLNAKGVPQAFTYYADVFYGTDYDTDIASYYEANEEKELENEGLTAIEPGLQGARPVTPRELAFVTRFEAKLTAAAALKPLPNRAISRSPAGFPTRSSRRSSRRRRWKRSTSSSTRSSCAPTASGSRCGES